MDEQQIESQEEDVFQFDDIKAELEAFRQNEMSSFQKIMDLFTSFTNDDLFYYIQGKKDYEDCDAFLASSTRDFFTRQIKIQLEDYIYPLVSNAPKKLIKDVVNEELLKVITLMELIALAYSFEKEDWKQIALVMLKLVEKRLATKRVKHSGD